METFWNWKSVEYSCFWYVNIRNIRKIFFFNIQDKILVILFHWMRNDDSKIKYNESEWEREQSITINNNKIKQVNSYYCESVIFQYYSFFFDQKNHHHLFHTIVCGKRKDRNRKKIWNLPRANQMKWWWWWWFTKKEKK